MPKLIINPGTPQAKEFELKPGTNYVGRGFANDFKIEDASVSTSHAQIVVNGNAAMIRDMGSTNGTYINRSQITESALQSGQMLRLGGVELLFQGDATATRAIPSGVALAAAPPQASAAAPAPIAGGLRIGTSHAAATPDAVITMPSGLRISSSSPAAVAAPPPPVAAPPMAPPIPAPARAAQPAGKTVCKFHPKSPGRWACPQCGNSYCDLCVGTRRATDGSTGYFCRPCGVQCSPLEVKVTLNPLTQQGFYSQLLGAFAYPFLNGGSFLLVCGTIFFVAVEFLKGYSLYLQIIFLGYLFAYMQNVIHTTAMGDDGKPSLPEVTNFIEDILGPCFQLIGTVILCFGPAIGVLIWAYMSENHMIALGFVPAMILGCLYFPMAFLAVAMFDTVTAINPMLIVPSICKVPLQYLVACIVLGTAFGIRWIGGGFLPMLIPIPVVPTVISSFLGLYFLTVQCRILGLLYLTNKQELGWFNR